MHTCTAAARSRCTLHLQPSVACCKKLIRIFNKLISILHVVVVALAVYQVLPWHLPLPVCQLLCHFIFVLLAGVVVVVVVIVFVCSGMSFGNRQLQQLQCCTRQLRHFKQLLHISLNVYTWHYRHCLSLSLSPSLPVLTTYLLSLSRA